MTVLVWWLACLLWSSTFLFIKIGLAEIAPFTFASLRLLIALCVLVPLSTRAAGWRTTTRADAAAIAAAGVVLLGVNSALLFWGAQHIPSGLTAIIQSATPLVALVFGTLLGVEAVAPHKLAAVGAGIAGVVIIFGADASVPSALAGLGALAVLGSSACVAFAYTWLKGRVASPSPLVVAALQSASAVLPLALLALIVEGPPDLVGWSATAWGALLYLALGASVLAFWLNYWLLARMDASAMLMMGIAEVPIAVALSAVVLGERVPPRTAAGALCILAGVLLRLRDVRSR